MKVINWKHRTEFYWPDCTHKLNSDEHTDCPYCRIAELEAALIEAEHDWEQERKNFRELQAKLDARCDHSELLDEIRELERHNKKLQKQDMHREKIWKKRVAELEEEIVCLTTTTPLHERLLTQRRTILAQKAKLDVMAEQYVNAVAKLDAVQATIKQVTTTCTTQAHEFHERSYPYSSLGIWVRVEDIMQALGEAK